MQKLRTKAAASQLQQSSGTTFAGGRKASGSEDVIQLAGQAATGLVGTVSKAASSKIVVLEPETLDDATLINMEILPLPMELESRFDYLSEDIRGIAWTALLGHVVQMMEGEHLHQGDFICLHRRPRN